MKQQVIIDTGPLVAYLKKEDHFHHWATSELAKIKPPLLTCEAVIVEACFLLRNTYQGEETVLSLLSTNNIQIPFYLSEEAAPVAELMKKYKTIPMSLADACLVRMSELISGSILLTLDSDFKIYRQNRDKIIPVIIPNEI